MLPQAQLALLKTELECTENYRDPTKLTKPKKMVDFVVNTTPIALIFSGCFNFMILYAYILKKNSFVKIEGVILGKSRHIALIVQ